MSSRPISDLIPDAFHRDLKKLSKTDWVEIAWDYARRNAGGDEADVMETFNDLMKTAQIVKQARSVEKLTPYEARKAAEARERLDLERQQVEEVLGPRRPR